MNTTAHTLRSSLAVMGAGLLLAVTGAALAPVALADTGAPTLEVDTAAPAEIGGGGLPVAFTTTASNTGTTDTSSARLIYRIDGGNGLTENSLSLEYRLDGKDWKPIPLSIVEGTVYGGELPEPFPLAAGASRTVQLRLGMPMGTPHHGDSNGGADRLKLTTMISHGASGAAGDSEVDEVAVEGLTSRLSGVPATATAGGAAITFRATVDNPTPSAYENVTDVLFTNRHTTVQVLRSGTWTTLEPITSPAEPDVYGFDVIGKDVSIPAHGSASAEVRVTYLKDAPAGKTELSPCAIVNEGDIPFRGITSCGDPASVLVKAAATTSPTGSPTPTATATVSPSPTPAVSRSGGATSSGMTAQLARTGSGGVSATAITAAGLVAVGAGALGFTAVRRRRGDRV
ncbi:hypothetical protein [Streptomyces sp. NBC_00525]|uniref:hypothetical protein n=1 Tax=Streptomyces sp. NBC_00525 TaxID=2903660 RepID=UPI002E823297|nr:hypothetical protein [Streptomyces sp. NBC_00525]WUC92282.1 hypothetical protein OG710_01090 [Streptomyces sp. NBC_00525]